MPSRPLLDQAFAAVRPHTGAVNRGRVTNDNMPTLEGRAQIGTTIHVFDNGGNEPIASVALGGRGVWAVKFPQPLADGVHQLTAISIDSAGEVSAVSRSYDIVIDTTPPDRPSINEVIRGDGAGHDVIPAGSVTNDAVPILKGTAEAGAIVKIQDTAEKYSLVTVYDTDNSSG